MATVTGLTAARMQEIADASIVSGEIVGDDLILTTSGGDDINAGNVVGPLGPTGSVVMFASLTPPSGWLLCDGSAVSRTTHADLFSVIGTSFGAGNGTTTFNVPNLKGRVAVGRDSAEPRFNDLGETGGEITHLLTTAEIPSHTHTQNSHNHTQDAHNHTQNSHNHIQDPHSHQVNPGLPGSGGTRLADTTNGFHVTLNTLTATATNQAATATNQAATATNQAATATNQNTGGGGTHNNLQPYIVMSYIIKT